MKTFVEIHALQNFAPSNLNRDDTGAPKDSLFGGTRRARISSQCLKKAIRTYFSTQIGKKVFAPEDMAVRTKRILDKLKEMLKSKGRELADSDRKVRSTLKSVGLTIDEDGKSQYLLFLGEREIARIADMINDQWNSISDSVDEPNEDNKSAKGKKKAAKASNQELGKALALLFDGGKAADIALFGRMLADMPDKNQDAACQVANAISTHVVEREFDFYTAVDDLKPEDTAGADMMGTIEFNSACFYRYALVDWDLLLKNLQSDDELAIKTLRLFLEGFVVAEPTGKQNTFAAHNPPEFVAVSVRHDASPRNLLNAFERAIRVSRDESLTERSAEALMEKAVVLNNAYSGAGQTFVLNLTGADSDRFGSRVSSFGELLDRTVAAVRE